MKIELAPAAAERIDDLVGTLDKLAQALHDNTAAIEAANAQRDFQLNGPRG